MNMEYKDLFERFLEDNYKGVGFEIGEIKENDKYVFAYLISPNSYDIPTLVLDKATKEVKDEIVPPFTDDSDAKTIWGKGKEQEGEDTEMDANKIRTLLKRYGAEDTEIENFMEDLENLKDEIEEDDDFNYLDNDTMEKLKATEEGKDLIMNAPKMAKEELKAAIKKYLSNAQ